MAIVSSPQDFNEDQLFVDLEPVVGQSLFLKIEGMNFAGSVKLKAAGEMVAAAERDGLLKPGSVLVESSSGNLGVALSMIAASKGYEFLCVTDSRCNLQTRLLMQAVGARVHIVTEPDPVSGLLGARMSYIEQLCASDERYVWLNQYTNPNAWMAHYRTTAPAIAAQFPDLDVFSSGRHDRDADGLRPLVQGAPPAGADRGGRRCRLGQLRRRPGAADAARAGDGGAAAAARRVLRR